MLYRSCICCSKPYSCHKALILIKAGAAAYWEKLLVHALQTGLSPVQVIFVMRTVVQRITVRKESVSGDRLENHLSRANN